MKNDNKLKRIIEPFTAFFDHQTLSGFLLLSTTAIALILANSAWSSSFLHLWEIPIDIRIGNFFGISMTIEQFINDGLMTIFFTVVGLEIKRELIEGELSTRQKALLPVVGALGGMLFPALIYVVFNYQNPEMLKGWAVPTATDIAFSLTVISLLGTRVPLGLKVFLTALAVVDDLGAIVIIALFYSSNTEVLFLLYALIVVLVLVIMNLKDVRNIYLYLFVGAFLWYFLHQAGVHATISGVILALTVPFRFKNYEFIYQTHLEKVLNFSKELSNQKEIKNHYVRDQIIEDMQKTSNTMEAPLNNLLYLLVDISSFVVMPLFALSNAGIVLDFNAVENLTSTLSLGIILGLMLGKPIGITLTIWITQKLKITQIPDVSWMQVFTVTILAGIGFTMSIFVTKLAFDNKTFIETAKFSIIIASVLSGILGYLAIRFVCKNEKT